MVGWRRMGALSDREVEQTTIAAVLDEVTSGRGSGVLVTGVPGSGKSEVLGWARHEATRRRMVVRAVRASPVETGQPLSVAGRLLPGDGSDDPATFVRRTLGLAGRSPQGLLLVVDDVERCDPDTLRFLTLLLDSVDQAPAAVLLAAGPAHRDESGQDQLALLADRTIVLPLGPLGPRGVARILVDQLGAHLGDEHAARLADACLTATGGNPFLVRELTAGLSAAVSRGQDPLEVVADVVPDRVVRAVRARLAGIGAGAVQLARAVAVLGPGAELGDAAAVAELSYATAAELAERLVTADVLRDEVALSIGRPLAARAVLADLGSLGRANLHRRAAEVLCARGADVTRIAGHLLEAPPSADGEVVRALRAAAAQAAQTGAADRAVAFLRRALREPPEPDVRGTVVLELARQEADLGEPVAGDRLAEALELTDDGDERVVALRELSRVQFIGERHPDAAATIRRAMAEAGPDSPMATDLLAEYIAAVTFGGAVVDAPTRAEFNHRVLELLDAHRTGTLPDHPALALQVASILAGARGRRSDVTALMDRFLDSGSLDDLPPYGLAASWAVLTLVAVDAVDLAMRISEDAYGAALRNGSMLRLGNAVFSFAVSSTAAGLLTRAEPECVKSLHLARSGVASTLVASAALLATVRRARGDLAGARRALAEADGTAPEGLSYGLLLHHRSMLTLAEGDCAGAWEESLRAREHLERFQLKDYPLAPWRLVAGLAGQAQGRTDEGRALLEEELGLARRAGTPSSIGHALLCLARVASPDDRLPLLEEAVEVLNGSGDLLRRAHAKTELGLLRAQQGADARELLQEAYELARTCGATPLTRQVGARLRRLGTRPRPVVVAGSPLTDAERRTVALARRGLSNREIAKALHLTPSTVEFHLTRVYRKLGVRSRSQLVDLPVEEGDG